VVTRFPQKICHCGKRPSHCQRLAAEEVDEGPRQHQHEPQAPGPVRKGGLALTLYAHSLSTVFAVLFVVSFLGHAASGTRQYNAEQRVHEETVATWVRVFCCYGIQEPHAVSPRPPPQTNPNAKGGVRHLD
jgi:hypothetical protein